MGAKQNGSSGDLAGYLSFWTNESAVQTEQVRITSGGSVRHSAIPRQVVSYNGSHRAGTEPGAFRDGHANTQIDGPSGLERRDGGARDHVRDLRQSPARGDLRGHSGDRVARGLGREGRRARDPRVHLDDRVLGGVRRERELDVAAALHAQGADDRERSAPQPLMHCQWGG